jgi:hypothetical protein
MLLLLVFFRLFITPSSLLSLALLSNHSLALSFALYPASDYHLRFVKTSSFLRYLLCIPHCLVFVPLYFVSVPLHFSSSFCPISFTVCHYLVTLYLLSHAQLNLSVSPYPQSILTDAILIVLCHWDIQNGKFDASCIAKLVIQMW